MSSLSTAPCLAAGRRVLIVEDEVLIAMVLEDMLDMLGHIVVSTPSTYAEAEVAIETGGFDTAILDVNLGRQPVFPLAERLRAAGVPIIFATGSHRDTLPPRFAECGVLEKPYAYAAVEALLKPVGVPAD